MSKPQFTQIVQKAKKILAEVRGPKGNPDTDGAFCLPRAKQNIDYCLPRWTSGPPIKEPHQRASSKSLFKEPQCGEPADEAGELLGEGALELRAVAALVEVFNHLNPLELRRQSGGWEVYSAA